MRVGAHARTIRATLAPAVARIRRLLDLDADPLAVARSWARTRSWGRSVPRTPAGAPAVRSMGPVEARGPRDRRAAGLGRLGDSRSWPGSAATLGTPLLSPSGRGDAPLPGRGHARGRAGCRAPRAHRATRHDLRAVAAAIADGTLVLGAGADRAGGAPPTPGIPGIGPWTAGYVALRALGDPDQLLVGDLAIRKAAARLGLPDDPAALATVGARWAPWRSYAVHHLWASLEAAPVNLASTQQHPHGSGDHR